MVAVAGTATTGSAAGPVSGAEGAEAVAAGVTSPGVARSFRASGRVGAVASTGLVSGPPSPCRTSVVCSGITVLPAWTRLESGVDAPAPRSAESLEEPDGSPSDPQPRARGRITISTERTRTRGHLETGKGRRRITGTPLQEIGVASCYSRRFPIMQANKGARVPALPFRFA